MINQKAVELEAYYLWLRYHKADQFVGNPCDPIDYWLAAERTVIMRWIYANETAIYWKVVADVRKQKEVDGYVGDLTVGGKPPVCGYETAEPFKREQEKFRSTLPAEYRAKTGL